MYVIYIYIYLQCICICRCRCMYVYIYNCIYMCLYIYVDMILYTHTDPSMYSSMHRCTYVSFHRSIFAISGVCHPVLSVPSHWKHPFDYAPIPLNGYYLRVTSINLSYIISKNPGSLWSVLTSGPAQKETLGKMLSGSIVVIKGFSCACEENTLNQQFMSFKTKHLQSRESKQNPVWVCDTIAKK